MKLALREAQQAFEADEVPIGAVVVMNDQVIARGHNMTEKLCDPTAHAEMIALTSEVSTCPKPRFTSPSNPAACVPEPCTGDK